MGNKEIVKKISLLAKLMELHGENQFKIRSFSSAYNALRKYPDPLAEKSASELLAIQGVGKTIAATILEFVESGTTQEFENFKEITPIGIIELLQIKGLGPKKVKLLWSELEIESPGELMYACKENRLTELKGFGQKTQANILDQLEYYFASTGKFHFARIESFASELLKKCKSDFPNDNFDYVGEFARNCTIISSLEIIGTSQNEEKINKLFELFANEYGIKINLDYYYVDGKSYDLEKFVKSCCKEYLTAFDFKLSNDKEQTIYENSNIDFHPVSLREGENVSWLNKEFNAKNLIQLDDIKGVVHTHTTYSDGMHSIQEMVDSSADLGYNYLVITDHSKSAFYANGLQEFRLEQQLEEMDQVSLPAKFQLFSGIESDILNNGNLDYDDDILELLDVVIASVHSVLKMDIDKATQRLITAIENPFTRILGHPTGRLLLSRKGYPVDFEKVIDACAANNVAIEMNANPHRLDMDWRFINKAQEKGVLISINPDAHSTQGIKDIRYGVLAAQKGGLLIENTLNAMSITEFEDWIRNK